MVIDIVLATDMSYHFQQLKNMKAMLAVPENINRPAALSMLVHCADISHPAKHWDLHHRWTDLLIEEFFRQGDREAELELPISPLCDRKSTMISESQIGFIDFIVDPSFQVMGDMLDKILAPLQQQRRKQRAEDIYRELSKATSRSSLSSTDQSPEGHDDEDDDVSNHSNDDSLSSDSRSKAGAETRFEVKRYWVECLRNNKQVWKEKAHRDAEQKAASAAPEEEEEERVISPNLGVLVVPHHKQIDDGTQDKSTGHDVVTLSDDDVDDDNDDEDDNKISESNQHGYEHEQIPNGSDLQARNGM